MTLRKMSSLTTKIKNLLIRYPFFQILARYLVCQMRIIYAHGNPFVSVISLYPSGAKVSVNPLDRAAQAGIMAHHKPYYRREQFVTYLIASWFNPDAFIDVGVNYGACLFSVPRDFSGRCFGFEANPALRRYIEKSMQMNDQLQVEMYWGVVSDGVDRQVSFFVHRRWSVKSSAITPENTNHHTKVQSTTFCLDDVITPSMGFHNVFIKIDVEGYEFKVINGFRKTMGELENVIGFVEFDSEYVRRAGQAPQKVIHDWMEMFDVYEINENEEVTRLDPIRVKQINDMQCFHSDFFLVKLSQPEWAARWGEIIKIGNLKRIYALTKEIGFAASEINKWMSINEKAS